MAVTQKNLLLRQTEEVMKSAEKSIIISKTNQINMHHLYYKKPIIDVNCLDE
jgi:hypothetical protein